MKNIADIFDIVLLLIVLGIMLPFLFSAVPELLKEESFGFEAPDDKTMKRLEGDILSDLNSKDDMTAAEIILMTGIADKDIVNHNSFILPDGQPVNVSKDYFLYVNQFVKKAQDSLENDARYHLWYDYDTGYWKIIN